MLLLTDYRKFIGPAVFLLCILTALYIGYNLQPLSAEVSGTKIFDIKSGESFRGIIERLNAQDLIRSPLTLTLFSLLSGSAHRLKTGTYELSPQMSSPEILDVLVRGRDQEAEVRILDGASIYEVDKILSENGVLRSGSLMHSYSSLEGRFFPDTYRFFLGSDAKTVVQKFKDTFEAKAVPILNRDPKNFEPNLILASLIEKEVPDFKDRQIVSGILRKRLKAGVPLQVDASICYVKEVVSGAPKDCALGPLDFRVDSPYNTYLYKGLPPGPIGSPGVMAIQAALTPVGSEYWFYLSDPKTQKTVFSKTLDEHNQNRVKYLLR